MPAIDTRLFTFRFGNMECVVCEQSTRKYKCVKCNAPYCSLNCYNTHKDSIKCMEQARAQTTPTVQEGGEEPTIYPPFKTEDTVQHSQLQQLAYSEPLRQLLHNPHLRALLRQVDVAHNIHITMTAAMQEPLFVEFANACLEVVEPMSEAERADLELLS